MAFIPVNNFQLIGAVVNKYNNYPDISVKLTKPTGNRVALQVSVLEQVLGNWLVLDQKELKAILTSLPIAHEYAAHIDAHIDSQLREHYGTLKQFKFKS